MHVRQWWFVTDIGSVALTIKYGSKVLEISKGKNAIEVTDGAQLLSVKRTKAHDVYAMGFFTSS